MKNFYSSVRKFAQQEEGATAVEYGIMVDLIAVAIIVAVAALGSQLNIFFTKIKNCLVDTTTCT
jgi:pilus assembly protein Flp/PilA